jgi:hypothetical protein
MALSRKPRAGKANTPAWRVRSVVACLAALALVVVPGTQAGDPPGGSRGSQAPSPGKTGTVAPVPQTDEKERDEAPKIDLEGRVEDKMPLPTLPRQNEWEYKAFYGTLVTAKYTPVDAFHHSADRKVTYAHLYQMPSRFRGQVVHYEGRLRRLVWVPASEYTESQGVKEYYEGWVFDPEMRGANPMCLIFTDLPKGLRPGEGLDQRVSFDGYFFKLYGYKAADDKWHACPMLIGHAPVLAQAPASPAEKQQGSVWDFTNWFVYGAIALVVLTAGVIVALNLWYRQGDRRIRSRLTAARNPQFVEPPFEDEGPANSDLGTSL